MELLTREQFRNAVFDRDGHKCLFCDETSNLDAHHIMERKLFPDGGYYIDNGATLCAKHHIQAETTDLSTTAIREKAGIKNIVLPDHLSEEDDFDKWGNVILSDTQRSPGELFHDQNTQKALVNKLSYFVKFTKYPRTYHLPWSEGRHKDDRILKDCSSFENKECIVQIKYDGENCNLYSDHYHARSLDTRHHASRSWIKNFHSQIAHNIPERWRICGENLFAKHSIKYTNLKSYFYGFSIWDERNVCLNVGDTVEWFNLLGIEYAKVIYQGIFNENDIQKAFENYVKRTKEEHEGYVIRTYDEFHYKDFKNCVAKYVRKNHVQTSNHWMFANLEKNELQK